MGTWVSCIHSGVSQDSEFILKSCLNLVCLSPKKINFISVTNITLTGSAMVNWSRDLLIQGVTTVIMVSIHALGHCFGGSASKEGFRSPRHCKQIRSGWEVETLVYSDEGRCLHRKWSGSATSRPCTTGTYWRCSRHIDIHTGYSCKV